MVEPKPPRSRPRRQAGRRVLVIVNGLVRGRRRRRLEAVLARLEGLGCTVETLETRGPGEAEGMARHGAASGHDVVVAAGGDGTVNEVVNGLAGRATLLAVLPLGTANVLAAEIGLPRAPRQLAELVAHGQARPIHPGRVDRRRFVMMAGAGLDAHAVAAVDPRLKRRLGMGAYWLALLRAYLSFSYPSYRVEVGGTAHRAASVVVANGHYYAGRFVCASEARLDEPGFRLCLFAAPGRLSALRYGLALLLGRLEGRADYTVIAARALTISGPPGEPVQADGELVATLPARFEVAPEPLYLIMPA
jgi:YegS/Rv2252/BmrU family lipid kinase